MSKLNINKRQVKILEILKESGPSTSVILCKLVGATKKTVLDDLKRLLYIGLITNLSINPRCIVAQIV